MSGQEYWDREKMRWDCPRCQGVPGVSGVLAVHCYDAGYWFAKLGEPDITCNCRHLNCPYWDRGCRYGSNGIYRRRNQSNRKQRIRDQKCDHPGCVKAMVKTLPRVCAVCGGDARPLTVDHIVPLVYGGQHCGQNIQLLCQPCHSAKTKRDDRIYPQE